MLLLTSTTDQIQLGTSAATAVHAQTSYVDYSSSTATPGRLNTSIAAVAAATAIVGPPAASTQRNVKQITVRAKGGANTVTLIHTDGTTAVELISVALAAGYSLVFTDGYGFEVLTDTGQLAGTGGTAVGAISANTFAAAGSAGAAATFLRTDAALPMSRALVPADVRGWQFLGTATGAAVTVGPVTTTGTFRQFMVMYVVAGYSGGTPVGRLLMGAAAPSTTALTNGSTLSEGVTAPTSAPSIPGLPLAVTLSSIARQGIIYIDGASGSFKNLDVIGQNGNPAVATPPTLYRAAGVFSDLGTNLPLKQFQLTVYDTLVATAVSVNTFTAGTYLAVWGRNTD